MKHPSPEVLIVNPKQLKDVAVSAKEQLLNPGDADLIEKVFESYEYESGQIGHKNMSIQRLKAMLFGAKTEKTEDETIKTGVAPEPDAPAPESEKEG